MEKINLKKICYELKDTFLVAGEKSIDLRNKGLIEKIKSDNTPVTNGDLEVNKLISEKIKILTPEIPIVSLVGRAGCGKTLCAIAAGMEQCLGSKEYSKLIVSRPVQPMGKDIGFLPGTLEEKMMPWLAPIQDNLQFLLGNDKMTMDMYM